MKIKKLLPYAASFGVCASLLATVLTSCSSAKIDDDQKIELDSDGKFADGALFATGLDYKTAIEMALTRSSSWETFRTALAEEIVYQWYLNRAAKSKDDKSKESKNIQFRVNLDNWKKDADDSYDDQVQSAKDKYNQNWKFYLQNEILAPVGGSVENYKHSQIVSNVKKDFVDNLWKTNYFGYAEGWNPTSTKIFQRSFIDARPGLDEYTLNNPASWSKLGFYAKAGGSFQEPEPGSYDKVPIYAMAKDLSSDYATIQNFVFNRWFDTEKPFFSAAALFKYSNPKKVGSGKLDGIYDTSTGITLPTDNPNEAFPFFGGYSIDEPNKGTRAYYHWYHDLIEGRFLTTYDDGGTNKSNKTTTIIKTDTEDSQTLLLSFGNGMLSSESGKGLYVPYAAAAASLYLQMMDKIKIVEDNPKMNTMKAAYIAGLMNDPETEYCQDNKTVILQNFFFPTKPTNGDVTLNSYVDLEKIYEYDVDTDTNKYHHSKLFVSPTKTSDFSFFYGRTNEQPGIRYITNTMYVDDLTATISSMGISESQPWILELNSAGMHAQTIDGYNYVKAETTNKREALMNVLKYRLMQKESKIHDDLISASVFGESGELKTYFDNHFADIILEMATSTDENVNIFRQIEEYKVNHRESIGETTFTVLASKLELTEDALFNYLNAIDTFNKAKNRVDACEMANNQMFSYHSEQITNSKFSYKLEKIYANGLTAPLAYDMSVSPYHGRRHEYITVNPITYYHFDDTGKFVGNLTDAFPSCLMTLKDNIEGCDFVKNDVAQLAVVDGSTPFSPQISAAKKSQSNRFWYKEPTSLVTDTIKIENVNIIDKMMYTFMGSKDGLANQIKSLSYDGYIDDLKSKGKLQHFDDQLIIDGPLRRAVIDTYYTSQLFTGTDNFATYAGSDTVAANFFTELNNSYLNKKNLDLEINGNYSDFQVSYELFKATLAYLMMDTNTSASGDPILFGNFYKSLNAMIGENDSAFVGYLNKVNANSTDMTRYKFSTANYGAATNPYIWTANVENIYDYVGYAGGTLPTGPTFEDAKVACDQYWNVVNKEFVLTTGGQQQLIQRTLAGFTGLQSETTKTIPDVVATAALNNFTKTSSGSLDHSSPDQAVQYKENDGAWFPFAGSYESNGDEIRFEIDNPDNPEEIVNENNLTGDYMPIRRLAKKIAHYTTIDDLKALAKDLGDASSGRDWFDQVGSGQVPFTDKDKMKWEMMDHLPYIEDGGSEHNPTLLHCFKRVKNVELHEEGWDPDGSGQNKPYVIKDESANAYKLMMTQINKADITERTLSPKWDSTKQMWATGDNSPVTADEFFTMLCQMANQASVQSLAISQVVKTIFGKPKLVVHDANLYNVFDSVWIKDWTKKPIGQ